MVDFRDPSVLLLDYIALLKICHTLGGLYIWEFVTTLDYEWRVIQGHQPYRWTIWIYSFTRLSTLAAVIGNITSLNITGQTNCQALSTISFIFAYMTSVSSSLLIILRIIAIWNKNKVIVSLVTIIWVANISFIIYGIIQLRSAWISAQRVCSIPDYESNKVTIIFMVITDCFLLTVMVIGLLRMRIHGAGTFSLGQLLWKQGIIWLLLATVADLPPVVFICLNLNNAFNMMFLMPSMIIMSIAATRMYRSLVDFLSNHVAMDSEPPRRIGHTASNAKLTFAVPTPKKRVEVAVHTIHEEYPISLTDHNVLYIGNHHPSQSELHDKQDDLRFDDDIESGMWKQSPRLEVEGG